MKERERILELVKQGIISTEEALVLLESSAKKDGKEAVKRDQTAAQNQSFVKEPMESSPVEETNDEDTKQEKHDELKEEQKKDKEQLEAILEKLANEASTYSVQLDEKNSEIVEVKEQLSRAKEKLSVLETLEDLDALDSEKEPELKQLSHEIEEHEAQLVDLEEDRVKLMDQLRVVKQKQWGSQKKQLIEKFEIPDDWKDTANERMNQVGEKMTEAGNQFGKLMKNTFSSVMENMDWKDVNVRMPGIASTKFTHEFNYPDSMASIIDVKVANGDVVFKTWEGQDIKVESEIKIYGKIDSDTPFEAFLKRSTIDVTDEKILFHIPNKRVRCDMIFYLPERVYDHTAIKLLNGTVKIEAFEGKDIYIKCTNGDIGFEKVTATMIETEGVNGKVSILDSNVRDLIVNSINGGIVAKGSFNGVDLSTVNGTVKLTVLNTDVQHLEATSVNGAIKVSVPKEISIEGNAKSNLGSIQNRMKNTETIKEKKDRTNQLLEFRRYNESNPVALNVSTTTGYIFLKDNETSE
ncbi:DUF4097 and DUF4098 domain-containing protein YvlB [Carnobacterium iners]|uniref:DUF4097 and DUF4098 domain-containing protein YvlB n=1 Tax=Carnobacterium iners TaxID=1073423 RepID=A0A1X7MSC6_9LACT|nr:daptomycin-sensing surface protein LiaX [Carnobacterium iners]SEK86783.1 DUF4097 and DUF4098 domain-containing protein YvlB [Carnobacterium iners]SMH26863.1 DUF4097 and DUF4098 domain-containing protein YvlB [Carnobacterium iners]